MADHAITLMPYQPGPIPDMQGMISETVKVVGTGGTSGVYTSQFVKQPQFVRGPFSYSINGQAVTLTSTAFTGTESAQIVGFA